MSTNVLAIKERLGIVDVVSSYIKLDKAGVNFKARCPFHNEKTPSFFVSPTRGSFYCFGCNIKGDIFTFVEEFEGLDFRGALNILAKRAGVTLQRENLAQRDEREKIYLCLEKACVVFETTLSRQTEATKYLRGRGVTPETVKKWRIGYADDSWTGMREHLNKAGFKDKEIESAGLTKRTEKGYLDRFRGRIIFPLADTSGRIIGFSGRIFPEIKGRDAPKYLNSPETEVFKKGSFLYGFDKAKFDIRRLDYTVVVEGQMDLIMCHQAGITNVVASSGTAITEDQIKTLKRFSERIIFAMDADSAGFRSTVRTTGIALSLGMEVKVASLPEGNDPADLVRDNSSVFREALKQSRPIVEFYLEKLKSKHDGREFLLAVEREVLPFVKVLQSKMEQEHYIKLIAAETGVSTNAVTDGLRKVRLPVENTSQEITPKSEVSKAVPRKDYILRRLFGLLFFHLESTGGRPELIFISEELKRILGDEDFNKAKKDMEIIKSDLVFEAEVHYHGGSNLIKETKEMLTIFEQDILKTKFIVSMQKLAAAERKHDQAAAKEFLQLCQDLSKRISKLSITSAAE